MRKILKLRVDSLVETSMPDSRILDMDHIMVKSITKNVKKYLWTEIISKRLNINFYHVRQQKEQKSRNAAAVSLKEKLNEYQEQNPDESFGAISELFSIKLQKKICRSMVGKYYRQIKAMKEKRIDLEKVESLLPHHRMTPERPKKKTSNNI